MKTVLITGCSSGIGKATVFYFQKKGWNVIATMRNPEKEMEFSSLDHVLVVGLDVTKSESIKKAIAKGVEAFGVIDVIVNNAGYAVVGPFEGTTEEQVGKEVLTNIIGVMNGTREILPLFRKQKYGTIINIASMGGRFTFPLYSVYHASKWAVEGFSESLQHELIPLNIKVKIIEPGTIQTNFYQKSMDLSKVNEAYKSYVDTVLPYMQSSGMYGSKPEVIARLIYNAAIDTSWRLRYAGGKNAKVGLFLRKILPDEIFNRLLRFAVVHNINL